MQDLESKFHTLEQAANDFNVPSLRVEAEKRITEFYSLQQPYTFCQFVLERSQQPYACFHAASILRKAVVREWSALSSETKDSLKNFILNYVMARKTALASYVKNQLLLCFAVLMKRAWLEQREQIKAQTLEIINMTMSQSHMHVIGLETLLALTEEFSIRRSSEIDMTFEFHLSSRVAFQKDALLPIFYLVLNMLGTLSKQPLSQESMVIILPALNLLVQILSWDFTSFEIANAFANKYRSRRVDTSTDDEKKVTRLVIPASEKEWAEAITNPQIISMLVSLHSLVRENTHLSHLARQCLIHMSSISIGSFPSQLPTATEQQQQPSRKLLFLSHILEAIFHLAASAFSTSNNGIPDGQELFDCCQSLLRVLANFRLDLVVQLPNAQHSLQQLSQFTLRMIQLAHTYPTEEWYVDSLESLLDAWVSLVSNGLRDVSSSTGSDPQHETIARLCGEVVQCYVEAQLSHSNNNNADDEEDDTGIDDMSGEPLQAGHLQSLSCLARQCLVPCLSYINAKLCTAIEAYSNANEKTDMKTVSNLLDDIEWLLFFVGYTLADDSNGEKPMIPMDLLFVTAANHPDYVNNSNCVVALISSVFRFAELEMMRLETTASIDASMLLSPRVASAVMWLCNRWVKSYLMFEPSLYPAEVHIGGILKEAYGVGSGGSQTVAAFILKKIVSNLFYWQSEPAVSRKTVTALKSLLEVKPARSFLSQTESFNRLVTADSNPHSHLASHPVEIRSSILECLCIGCTVADNETSQKLFYSLLYPLKLYFESIIFNADFVKNSNFQHPSAIEGVVYCIHKFRAVARASQSSNARIIFSFFASALTNNNAAAAAAANPMASSGSQRPTIRSPETIGIAVSGENVFTKLVKLVDLYHNRSDVVVEVLQFFAEFIEQQGTVMSMSDLRQLCGVCLDLCRVYKAYNAGVVRRKISSSIASEEEESQYTDLLTLLQLLTNLISRDYLDFSDSPNTSDSGVNSEIDIAAVVLFALDDILPLMTQQLLQYQKLCLQFFTLIGFLIEVYPEKAANLSPQLFQQLLSVVHFGLRHHDSSIAQCSYEAIGALANFHIQHKLANGGSGLTMQLAHNPGFLEQFLETILAIAIREDFDPCLISYISDALFALVIVDVEKYRAVVNRIISSYPDPNTQQRLAMAFTELQNGVALDTTEGQSRALLRLNKTRFAKNIEPFLLQVRIFCQSK